MTFSLSSRPSVGCLFLDSGAHSLFTKYVIKRQHRDGYSFYKTKEFLQYVDQYAAFVKEHKHILHYYANVDVIFNPELSWDTLKYLEQEHGLNPVPVIHWGTDLKWLDKHLDAGYSYIGLGGLGQEVTTQQYYDWADSIYTRLCPPPNYLPIVKTHGFAMTGYNLIVRYPWWSVDSSSWTKVGAYGSILVPHKRDGEFTFKVKPYVIGVSKEFPPNAQDRHYRTLSSKAQETVREWLQLIGVPLGENDEKGVITSHSCRKAANLFFYQKLCEQLPQWPWPFLPRENKQVRMIK